MSEGGMGSTPGSSTGGGMGGGEARRPDVPMGMTLGSPGSLARLPMPGNAEFVVWVIALIVLAIIAWIADGINSPDWYDFFKWTAAAYLLSRGIAKASRVLEA